MHVHAFSPMEIVTGAARAGIPVRKWLGFVRDAGLDIDHPGQWPAHFRVLADLRDRTGGFTKFVALPFVHTNAPIYLAGLARLGPTWRENRVVLAMARLLLHGRSGRGTGKSGSPPVRRAGTRHAEIRRNSPEGRYPGRV